MPAIETRGHRAEAIDLPAHGADRTPAWRATLASYADRILEAVAADAEPAILVGHSMGGIAITQAAARDASRLAGLVYVCAFVPEPGDSLVTLGRRDPETLVPSSARPGLAGIAIRPERAADVFYGTCSEADARWATARLRPDPYRPLFQGLRGSPPGRLPRAYVTCARDRAISLGWQREMAARLPEVRMAGLDCDHSPFLSEPEALAELLHGFA